MELTVDIIKSMALLLSGQRDIPDEYVLMFVNSALGDLAIRFDEAGKKETTYLYGVEDIWTDLPTNCISVKRCSKNGVPVTDYLIENGQIKFPTVGEYKIEYVKIPDLVLAITDVPKINVAFFEAIPYYVAYRELTRIFMHEDITEGNNKSMLIAEYNRKAEQANAKLRTMKKSRQHVKYAPMI